MEDGAAMQSLARDLSRTAREAKASASPELQQYGEALLTAFARVMAVVREAQCPSRQTQAATALANAHVFLEMTGHVVVAWIWLRQALVAAEKLETADNPDRDFYRGKLQVCRFFFRWELPKTVHWHALLDEPDPACEEMQDAWF
jgi:butyryl-CoA dehydrogenase